MVWGANDHYFIPQPRGDIQFCLVAGPFDQTHIEFKGGNCVTNGFGIANHDTGMPGWAVVRLGWLQKLTKQLWQYVVTNGGAGPDSQRLKLCRCVMCHLFDAGCTIEQSHRPWQ